MVLTEVLDRLEQAGIPASAGYPGANAGSVTACIAAVNLTALNEADGEAAVTVTVLSPRSQGLAACQTAAARTAAALRADGWQWSFRGWKYDSVLDCFTVELQGKTGITLENGQWTPLGLQVSIDGSAVASVASFTARQQQDRRLIRPHGQAEPVGVIPGRGGWSIELTQWLPLGEQEPEAPAEPFSLNVWQGGKTQIYTDCFWSERTVRCLPGGMELRWSGFALNREVV